MFINCCCVRKISVRPSMRAFAQIHVILCVQKSYIVWWESEFVSPKKPLTVQSTLPIGMSSHNVDYTVV